MICFAKEYPPYKLKQCTHELCMNCMIELSLNHIVCHKKLEELRCPMCRTSILLPQTSSRLEDSILRPNRRVQVDEHIGENEEEGRERRTLRIRQSIRGIGFSRGPVSVPIASESFVTIRSPRLGTLIREYQEPDHTGPFTKDDVLNILRRYVHEHGLQQENRYIVPDSRLMEIFGVIRPFLNSMLSRMLDEHMTCSN